MIKTLDWDINKIINSTEPQILKNKFFTNLPHRGCLNYNPSTNEHLLIYFKTKSEYFRTSLSTPRVAFVCNVA